MRLFSGVCVAVIACLGCGGAAAPASQGGTTPAIENQADPVTVSAPAGPVEVTATPEMGAAGAVRITAALVGEAHAGQPAIVELVVTPIHNGNGDTNVEMNPLFPTKLVVDANPAAGVPGAEIKIRADTPHPDATFTAQALTFRIPITPASSGALAMSARFSFAIDTPELSTPFKYALAWTLVVPR